MTVIDSSRRLRRTPIPCGCIALLAMACWSAAPPGAWGQEWPDRPVTLFDDRMVVGGEALLTVAPEDEGFFNYTDYDRSALRLVRLGVTTTIRATDRVSFLAEVRAEGDIGEGQWTGEPYALFVRVRPWLHRTFEIHAGRIPPAFGGFLRRSYGRDNPLIGYPLAYQYLTSLRTDALPRHADDLIDRRGSGWYTGYPIGNPDWAHGVPMVSAFRYDTGVLGRLALQSNRLELLGSATTGTLSNPRVDDDNGSPQFAGRVVSRPVTGLVVGFSAARGAFLANRLRADLPAGSRPSEYAQRALGFDIEYSRDYWVLRTEWLHTAWRLPALAAPPLDESLGAGSVAIEGRYTLAPGLYAAARIDRLSFSTITGSVGRVPWDANVSRVETGIGYAVTRNIIIKTAYQYNRRDGGYVRRAHYGAAQLLLWF
jgi:hypothetical protein